MIMTMTCPQCHRVFARRHDRPGACSRTCAARLRRSEANANWRGGTTRHPLYGVYNEMLARCVRQSHARYADYGGRGITVCERWRADFWAFVSDMGPRPDGLSLDRMDNKKGYSPENCRWATWHEQNANRRKPSQV